MVEDEKPKTVEEAKPPKVVPGDILRPRFVNKEDSITYKKVKASQEMFASMNEKKTLVVLMSEAVGDVGILVIEGVLGVWMSDDFDVIGHTDNNMCKRSEELNRIMKDKNVTICRSEVTQAIGDGVSDALSNIVMGKFNAVVSVAEIMVGVNDALVEFIVAFESRKKIIEEVVSEIKEECNKSFATKEMFKTLVDYKSSTEDSKNEPMYR